MESNSTCDRLNTLCDELFGPDRSSRRPQLGFLGALDWPFDVSRPNIHKKKADIKIELEAVKQVLENIREVQNAIGAVDEIEGRVVESRSLAVSITVRRNPWPSYRPTPRTPIDLVRQNVKDVGFHDASQAVLEDMVEAYEERLTELEAQEVEF